MGFKLVTLLIVCSINLECIAGSCLCHVVPNFSCPPPPYCCESGMYTFDECGCCLECAKSELQPCGASAQIDGTGGGKCAKGLSCLKTCASCGTLGADSEPCVFPFVYEGVKYDKCTSTHAAEGAVWCATQVHANETVIEGRWGDCTEGCPGARLDCNEQRFSIIEGRCVNPAVPGAIPNWFGAPAYKLLPPTEDLFRAPICDQDSARKQKRLLYENTCRCAQGEDAVEMNADGSIRGNCTGVDPNLQDNINPVWCFLENVRDHNHPASGCYSDTTWSSKDGRFWSSMACKGLPPIADFGIEELPDAPLHLLGRNHPFVREQQVTKKSGGGLRTTTSTTTTELPLNPVEFPFYYEDYGEVAYNYDDQAYVDHDGDGIPNVLPIINHQREQQQQQKSPFLPTPLPQTSTSETLVTADPLPLTTMKVETTTTSTTTTTSAPTTILEVNPSSSTTVTTLQQEEETVTTPPPTILPASTSMWKEVNQEKILSTDDKVENEIIEETTTKDGSKLVIVQALQRAAKNTADFPSELNPNSGPDNQVDLGIFGSFWLQKPRNIRQDRSTDRPKPVFRKEDYLDKFPELRM